VRVARAVTLGSRRVGSVYLIGNMNELRDRLAVQSLAVFGGMALAIAAALAIARRLQHIISEPVTSLASTADAISRGGDYALRASRAGDDEVGRLVDAFNDMVGQVDRRERERVDILRREQEANRLKDEFLAALSHELRTPLNAILGWLQILRSAPPSAQTIERALGSLDRNARAQMRLIEDLLDISRIISGKLHLDVAPLDFGAVVESAVDVMRPAAQAKQIAIDLDVRARCVMMGDADRLRQAVWNLLSNAVKFTPNAGRITVAVTATQGACELTVGDNGVGIAAEFLPFVFDRFRQADGSMTRQHGGLGLGLSIVREVIEAHGGQAAVASAGPGQGALFTLTLPIVPAAKLPPDGPRVAPAAVRPLADRRVLVVDDDADAREVARTALSGAGAIVETADSAEDALARTRGQRFDALICDIAMPGVDGYELLRRLRERDGAQGIPPAIALSAFASHEAESRALAAGFQRFLAKPYNFSDLVQAVAGVSRAGLA
jgi:signal transduction histidine kinase/CheY-like chemotaxis protein